MTPIPFSKLSGTGNDFIVIDNRADLVAVNDMPGFVRAVCRRAVSVGADGVIFVQNHPDLDFAWRFFNADGGEAEMCGNGSRCVARFAHERGIAGTTMRFMTLAGPIRAEILDGVRVRVQLTPAKDYRVFDLHTDRINAKGFFLNTGVPHAVITTADVNAVDVRAMGRSIRFARAFAPAGANANFVQVVGEKELIIRTYERGVEDETLACGTGCVASAATMVINGLVKPPVTLTVRSGETLVVDISPKDTLSGEFYLEGPAHWIYDGVLREEAL